MSMGNQELLEKTGTDLAVCQKVIFYSPDQLGDCSQEIRFTHQLCIICFVRQTFSWFEPFSTIISVPEYLARAQRTALCLRNMTKHCKMHRWDDEGSCWLLRPQYFLCSLSFCLPLLTTATGVQKVAIGSETLSHSFAGRKGKLRSTRKKYHCVLSEIMSIISHVLELHDLLLN